MDFEWDPNKRARNLEKHGIDFIDTQDVFEQEHVVARSDRKGERRYTAVGMAGDVVIAVSYAVRGSCIRIISARRARANEREKYKALYG